MIRVIRYDKAGAVFHDVLTPPVVEVGNDEHGKIYIDMPLRFWRMVPGGRVEISWHSEAAR